MITFSLLGLKCVRNNIDHNEIIAIEALKSILSPNSSNQDSDQKGARLGSVSGAGGRFRSSDPLFSTWTVG